MDKDHRRYRETQNFSPISTFSTLDPQTPLTSAIWFLGRKTAIETTTNRGQWVVNGE